MPQKPKKSKKNLAKPFKFNESVEEWGKNRAKELKMDEHEFWESVISDNNYALVEFNETTGKATLKVFDFSQVVTEEGKGEDIYASYKDLRENFAPVSAGVEYHRTFMVGSGFDIVIEDPKDKHQLEMQKETINLCKDVYQDFYNRGLDKLLYILIDTALTVGAAAAEIVYGKEIDFTDFSTTRKEIRDNKTVEVITTKMPTTAQWKSFKGITKLKIIKGAVSRLKPVFDNKSYEVLYWTLDAPKGTEKDPKKEPAKKFLPWQILWLSWNTRETDLIGKSVVQPVASIAKIVRAIHLAVGEGFHRWANRKYFFVCGTDKRPWGKVAQANFLKLLKQMIKNNWTGIPVPQGFDVKEIGGEVFQGRDILDHFISMIAAGMNYPRDFLEFGRTRAGDKAWLAWQVKYGSAQRQVRRAIEQQLIEKHLWCKFGKIYRVPLQGVKPKDREKRPIYVPKIRWKAEGRWQQKEELESLQGWLNVANPIGPEFKLGVEKRAAEILGLTEVEFPTYAELRRELKAQAKMMEEQMMKGPTKKVPPTKEEQLEARQKGGVSKQKAKTGAESKRGESKKMGGTRQAKLIKKKEFAEVVEDVKNEIIDGIKAGKGEIIAGTKKEIEAIVQAGIKKLETETGKIFDKELRGVKKEVSKAVKEISEVTEKSKMKVIEKAKKAIEKIEAEE